MYTFAKMCCLCLNNKCSLINFKDCDLDNISAYDKLEEFIPELVSETNNKLPTWICLKCKEELDNTYIFYKKCRKALYLLQSYNKQLQSFDNNSNLPQQDSYSLNINISTKNSSFDNVPHKKVAFVFDENITEKSSLEKENNVEFTTIKEEINDVDKIPSIAETEETDSVKEELFTEDTFLFDKIIAETSLLEKENKQEFTPIKEETSDAHEETPNAHTETSNKHKETSNSNKETFNSNKEISNSNKDTSYEETSTSDKEKCEILKEEHNLLFEEDTLPFGENSSESNISITKNEINSNIFNKNEEIRRFDIFSNKSALESVVQAKSDSFTSIITTESDKVILEEKSDKNPQNEEDLSHRGRRRTRPVYYNESEDESGDFNDDSDFEPDLNINFNNIMSDDDDDHLSDTSVSDDVSSQSAKRLKTSNSTQQPKSNSNLFCDSVLSLRPQTNVNSASSFKPQSVVNSTSSLNPQTVINSASSLNPQSVVNSTSSLNPQSVVNSASSLRPQTVINPANTSDSPEKSATNNTFSYFNNVPPPEIRKPQDLLTFSNFNNVNRLRTPIPAIVIHHLPQTENQTNGPTEPLNVNPVVLPQTTTTNESPKPAKKIKTFRRKYVCNICRNKFKSSTELKEHMSSHELKEFKCKICHKLCVNDNDLKLHMTEHTAPPPPPAVLKYNPKDFRDKHQISISSVLASRLHQPTLMTTKYGVVKTLQIPGIIEINSDEDEDYYMEKYFCNICNKKFKDFPAHMTIHQNENKAICVYCETTFPIKNQLFQHLRDVHCASEPICQICNETFQNIDLLFLHMYSHYGTHVHRCPSDNCEQLFLQANLMYRHLEEVHKCTEFKCFKCDETFDSCKAVTYHTFHHESTSSTLCFYCGKGFKSRRRLQIHIDNLHAPAEAYLCKECGKQCPSRQRLRDHIDSSHANNTYECHVCSKFFNTRLALYMHRSTHTEQTKKFACKVCGKKFAYKFLVKNHERIHTGEKPFECKTCGKKFTQEVSLVVHKRIHTGEKPYVCHDCGKSYTQSYVYKMHLKKHHGSEDSDKTSSKEKD